MNGITLELLIKMYKCEYNKLYDFLPTNEGSTSISNLIFNGIVDHKTGTSFLFEDDNDNTYWFSTEKSFEEWGLVKRE